MSSDKMQCAGCLKSIEDRRFLFCGNCKQFYDLECANVSEQRFFNTLTREHRETWRCVLCISKQPKGDNSNTPVRVAFDGITLERGAAPRNIMDLDMSLCEQSLSITDNLNDTAHNATLEVSDFQSLIMEMRMFRSDMKEELRANRAQLELLNQTLIGLSGRVLTCEGRIDQMEARVAALEQRGSGTVAVEPDGGSLAATIRELKLELRERDQEMLMNDVEISCIPEQGRESLPHIAKTIARKLGIELADQDMVSVVRVGLPPSRTSDTSTSEPSFSRPRPIVMRLARRGVRDELLTAARVRRGATTEGLELPGPTSRFYVNERLTKPNRQLFQRARVLGKQLRWRFVWSRNGRIYARQYDSKDAPRYHLRTEEDLSRVFGSNAVCASD